MKIIKWEILKNGFRGVFISITASTIPLSEMFLKYSYLEDFFGWVGLIVPHLASMLVGPNYKVLLPVSIAIGSVYMLLVDDLARCLTSAEIPLGILTSIIGAPFFFAILLRGKKGMV